MDDGGSMLKNERLFTSQMPVDFPVLLTKDGHWGTYKPVSDNVVEDTEKILRNYLATSMR